MKTTLELHHELSARCDELICMLRGYLSTDDEFDTHELLDITRLLHAHHIAADALFFTDDREPADDLLAATIIDHLTNGV